MRCCVSVEINSVWGPDGGKEDRNISRETTTRGREELKPRITSASLLGLLVSSLSKHFDTAHFFTLFKSIVPAYTLTSFLTKPWWNLSLAASSGMWLEKGTQPWGLSHIDCMSVNCRRPRSPRRWTLLLPEEVISHLLFFPKFPAPPHWSSLSGGDDLHSNWGNRRVHKGTSSTFPVKSTNALAFGLAHFAFSAATNEQQSVLPSHLHPSLSCIFGFLPSLDQSHYIHICWYLFFKCLIVMKYT